MSATITFDELEYRSYSVMAAASEAIVKVARESRHSVTHYKIVLSLRAVSRDMKDLLAMMHSKESIVVIESASLEQLSELAQRLSEVHAKVVQAIAKIRSRRSGYWGHLSQSPLTTLERYNNELDAYVRAFKDAEPRLILLSKADQEQLLAAILTSTGPSAELWRAFELKK